MASAVTSAEAGKPELVWPVFKPTKPDPFPGKKEMSPEQTLIEFISTSAGLHGVRKQSLRSLEWDLLKVFPYNIMPANAAAWYMAKRKFYADQPPDQQLLPVILKKYPNKFLVKKFQVEFLETYSKETAKRKLTYLVQYGIDAYFSHKVDEYGVYFFDPNYYERTEPFYESLRICTKGVKSKYRLASTYFGEKKNLSYKAHSNSLSTVTKDPNTKILSNTTCVIVSMVNNQYGFLKFGNGDKALFCAKALFRDGWQYTGDPLRLPAMHFDGYQVPGGTTRIGESCKWVAVLVWCGRKPAPKFYSTLADFSLTKEGLVESTAPVEGRRLRQPSSSMMIGQVISIRKNGAVISVRDGRPEQVFVPGWSKENAGKPGIWLTTLSGETIGLRDLVAYYIDTEESVPGFAAVGKNVIVLKEHEEVDSKKKRRNRESVAMSEGAFYEPKLSESDQSDYSSITEESEGEAVSDGELEWLENDLEKIMEKDGPEATTRSLFLMVKERLAEARANTAGKKVKTRERKDSGVGSNPTTPSPRERNNGPLKVGKRSPDVRNFWRTKAALAKIEEGYRSSDDEDYNCGDEISSVELKRSRKQSTTSTSTTKSRKRRGKTRGVSESTDTNSVEKVTLPYWVRAISYPEEYDDTTGKFLPVDKWYVEEKDPDYNPPLTDDDYEDEEDKVETETAENETAEKVENSAEDKEAPGDVQEVKVAQKEDLDEELKMLLEEASMPVPEDLVEGKHKSSAKKEAMPDTEGDVEEKAEIVTIQDQETVKEVKIFYYPNYLEFAERIQADSEDYPDDVESNADPEYVPPAIIFDEDCDYDEYNPEDEVLDGELKSLEEEAQIELHKAANYIPIWVHVDSVKERIECALIEKKKREEEQAEKEAALKAAQDKEAKEKGAGDNESEGPTADGLGDAPKPQRKLSTRSKSEDAKKESSKTNSPKKDVKDSPKRDSPKKEGKKDSPKKSPKKGSPGRKDETEDSAQKS